MLTINDINNIECDDQCSEADYYASLQRAINSGGAWSFQGSYGRTMMGAIEDGYCLLGKTRARDYYGNVIPSRDDVQPGTKGSYEYVARCNGDEYADMLAAI